MSIDPAVRPIDSAATHIAAVAETLVQGLDGALRASVAEPVDDVLTVHVTTDPLLEPCGSPSAGPTIEALLLRRIVRIPSTPRSREWPEHCADLARQGVLSVGAFPIKDPAGTTLGVLTVSSQDHHGFGAADIVACRVAADEMAALISTVHARSFPDRV